MRILLYVFILFLICSVPVHAVAIGVNRADLPIRDVLREGYAEETFVVSTDSATEITGVVEVEGNITEWVSFSPANVTEGFSFSAEKQMPITVIVQPSADAANGNYEGTVRVLTGEIDRGGNSQFGTGLRAALKIGVVVGITGIERRQCVLGGINVLSTEVNQPLDIAYTVKNTGNVRVQPEMRLTIYDQFEETVVFEERFTAVQSILPTRQEEFINQVALDLPVGQYWASVYSDDCTQSSTVTFDVLDRGGVLDTGEFVALEAEPWNQVGDIIPITAVFRNTGERTVGAKLKGTIFQGKKIIKVIDTDMYNTPPGQTARIETFFNPTEPGQYEIKGRVFYNNKLTSERITIINVRGEGLRNSSFPWGILLLFIILFFLFLIMRKKKRRF